MKVLVIGGGGMLGHKLAQVLSTRFNVWATVRDDGSELQSLDLIDHDRLIPNVDIQDLDSLSRAFGVAQPDCVINAVGVIKQICTPANMIATINANAVFPHMLAEIATEFDSRLITISTDCVFTGQKGNYSETDPTDAADVYGKTKALGELMLPNCLTIRTSIIGRELTSSHSLVEWFLGQAGPSVAGYINAIYSGFPTIVLADIIGDLIGRFPSLSGLYHVSSDPINKFELLGLFNKYFNKGLEIYPSGDLVIDRSLNSQKFREATGFRSESWEEMVERMASDPTPYDKWRR